MCPATPGHLNQVLLETYDSHPVFIPGFPFPKMRNYTVFGWCVLDSLELGLKPEELPQPEHPEQLEAVI